jgi:hypothetical protein
MWRGGVGAAYLLPALSSAGASIASPCCRFHIPLIEPDVRISRFRLSEKGSEVFGQLKYLMLLSCPSNLAYHSPLPHAFRITSELPTTRK